MRNITFVTRNICCRKIALNALLVCSPLLCCRSYLCFRGTEIKVSLNFICTCTWMWHRRCIHVCSHNVGGLCTSTHVHAFNTDDLCTRSPWCIQLIALLECVSKRFSCKSNFQERWNTMAHVLLLIRKSWDHLWFPTFNFVSLLACARINLRKSF